MANKFIPNFHLVPAAQKLTPEWCREAINYYWHSGNNKSLLHGKKVNEIEEYFSGDINMRNFMAMYKSVKKRMVDKETDPNKRWLLNNEPDMDEIVFLPFSLICSKLNSAIAVLQKIPDEVSCTAADALAMKKKKEDITFLKNKPALEEQLQEIADQLNIGKVDLGTTKYSYTKFSGNPLGMDLNNPEEESMFTDLLYALDVEGAMEDVLQQFWDLKSMKMIKLLNIKDQYKYAVHANRAFQSSTTGLPDVEYIYPGDIKVPYSSLPDYSDNESRYIDYEMTVDQMFNQFGSEIGSKDDLLNIINGKDKWCYCQANNLQSIPERNFTSTKIRVKYCEVRSVDYVGIYKNAKSTRNLMTFTDDETKITEKIWGQNTYKFFWLENTRFYFDIGKLDYAYRTKGKESFQNFSTNIYKSNLKSAVELAIPENKIAQIAYIKMTFAIVMAKADGIYIDIRGLRNALDTLTEEGAGYTIDDLLSLALEKNIIIADTDGFEGKNDGQFKPVIPIDGGVKNVMAYLQVIEASDRKINQFIGTNDSLTGMSANTDALIGVEKLRINASINGLYYVTEAIENTNNKVLNIWGNVIQASIAEGGDVKKSMINYIGSDNVDLLEGLNQTPLHNLTIKYSLKQREEEREQYRQQLNFLKSKNIISTTDEYILSAITNPKKRFGKLAVIENKYKKEQDKIRQEQFAQQQKLQDQASQGILAATNAATDGKIKAIYATADAESKIDQLRNSLGLQNKQYDYMFKKNLQQDRAQSQLEKLLKGTDAKANAKQQEALPLI